MKGPPAPLQWLAVLFSAFSLWVALPSYLQRRFGAPRLVLRFGLRDVGDTHVLECQIFNQPIQHPLLRRFGIRRGEAEVTAGILLRDVETSRYVTETVPIISIMGTGRSTQQRVVLRESADPALIAIAAAERGENLFDPLGERLPLMPGEYWADVNVNYGDRQENASAIFVVPEQGELHWRHGGAG
jgi:hypothetical protein